MLKPENERFMANVSNGFNDFFHILTTVVRMLTEETFEDFKTPIRKVSKLLISLIRLLLVGLA